MDIEVQVFDEINNYKEKIYFFNIRQWIFSILIIIVVIPTYLLLKNIIGEELTSYIVLIEASILGFFGFIKIHELPAEKLLPYWLRQYMVFCKEIPYITEKEFENNKKKNKKIGHVRVEKIKRRDLEKNKKEQKILEKAKKKYKVTGREIENKENDKTEKLSKKLSELTQEEQEVLLKLLER